MQDAKLSSPESLRPSSDLSQILSSEVGPDSQTQTQQFAGGNASTVGDQLWVPTSQIACKNLCETRGTPCRDTTHVSESAASRFSAKIVASFVYWCLFGSTLQQKHDEMWTFPMSAPSPKSLSRAPQTRCCTGHAPSPNRTHEKGCEATSRSKSPTIIQHQ